MAVRRVHQNPVHFLFLFFVFCPSRCMVTYSSMTARLKSWITIADQKGCFDKLLMLCKVHMSPAVCPINPHCVLLCGCLLWWQRAQADYACFLFHWHCNTVVAITSLIPIDSELSCKSFNDSQCVGSISVILPSPLGLTFYNVYFNLQEPRGCFNFCNMHSSSEAHHTQTVRSLHTCCLGPFMLKVSCREDNMVH